MEKTKTTSSVLVIDRTFKVLELVSQNGSMSLKDLYTSLGINKASVYRIATSLCDNGYLNQDEKSGNYTLSFKAFEVGVNAVKNLSYINMIKSSLENLSSTLDVIAQFSIEDNNELLCLECFNNNNASFSIYTNVGQRTPLYATSAGKAILSTYSNEEIRSKWEKMHVQQLMPNTITSYERFIQEIALVRQKNYATDKEESEPGVFCVGTVLLNYNRRPIGSISLSLNYMDDEIEKKLSKTLLEHTQRMSYMLGYTN